MTLPSLLGLPLRCFFFALATRTSSSEISISMSSEDFLYFRFCFGFWIELSLASSPLIEESDEISVAEFLAAGLKSESSEDLYSSEPSSSWGVCAAMTTKADWQKSGQTFDQICRDLLKMIEGGLLADSPGAQDVIRCRHGERRRRVTRRAATNARTA